ncbi:MAG TPA: hypothetical protein VFG51_01715 [Candidatus Saccharimonadia bacterium]|nr:hypothetical protein [Candidatus Saccharimonadia bacterium]
MSPRRISHKTSFSPLQTAIFRTVCYADVFAFPLTVDELLAGLITKKPVSHTAVERAIKTLPKVRLRVGYVCLRGHESIIAKRRSNLRYQTIKLASAHTIVKLIGWIPMISAIFVTGSLAAHNAVASDDIDVMIVTRPGWLWTTRAAVVLLSVAVGKYRTRSTDHVNNMWCFNMWLDETALKLPKSAQNLYTAHEVVQALPVLDKRGVAQWFLYENRWAKSFLANTAIEKPQRKPLADTTVSVFEGMFFVVQRWYMDSARTIEKVGRHFAFFHPRQTRSTIMQSYEKKIGEK